MSDFFETEAQESEDEEGQVVDADSSDDEEEEEEDDDAIDPALRDFITDDVEEEGGAGNEDDDEGVSRKKKKRKRFEEEEDIDEDDYNLIEENIGVNLKKKKLKRVQLDSDDEGQEDDVIPEAKKAIEKVLFESEEESGEDSDAEAKKAARKLERKRQREAERDLQAPQDDEDDDDSGEESDVNDFVVDDTGAPVSKRKGKKGKKGGKGAMTDENLAEAQELFGADFDFADLNNVHRSTAQGYYDDDEEEDEDYDDRYEEEMDDDDMDFIEDDDGQALSAKLKKTKIDKGRKVQVKKLVQFEPKHLEKGHYLPKDEEIKAKDIPERFQLRKVPVEVFQSEEEALEEAQWIFTQAFMKEFLTTQSVKRPSFNGTQNIEHVDEGQVSKHTGDFYGFNNDNKKPETVTKIRDVLKLLRDQMHEVPFIHNYRREFCEPELNEIYDLWTIWQNDERWMQLQSRKTKLTTLFMQMRNYLGSLTEKSEDYSRIAEIRPLEEFDIAQLKCAETMQQLEDVYQHFVLHYGHYITPMVESIKEEARKNRGEDGDEKPESKPIKRPQRKQLYHVCIKNKIYNFANLFGLSPEKFGENILDQYQKYEPTTSSQYPSDLALELICDAFATKEAVINAAVYMVAQQLCHEPSVRKSVRKSFEEKVGINVRPTKKGMREIDESHPLYPMKYLKGKEVCSLKDADYLNLHEGESQGLIVMTFKFREEVKASAASSMYGLEGYIEDLALLYYQDGYSEVVKAWNELRKKAVRMAVEKLLFPILETELKDRLLKEAHEFVIRESACHLHTLINLEPYKNTNNRTCMTDDEDDYDIGVRVVTIAHSDDNREPNFASYIDKNGVCRDYIRLPNLMRGDTSLRQQDFSALSDFVQRVRPHVVAVCTSSMRAKFLIINLEDMLSTLEQELSFPSVALELVNDDLAAVYEKSTKADKEFPDYPHLLRRSISAGRRLQDPLAEFCQIADDSTDLMSFKFHPLQNLVPEDDLIEALTVELVSMVNKVGVDVNKALEFPHFAPMVQFVCGLGPRKASAILQLLSRKNKKLVNRTQLVTEIQMGPKLFVNCAGFIKIDVRSFDPDSTDDETWLDPLDSSRIHPETYEWARKMAVDALEYDDVDTDEMGQQKTARAVEEIMETPDKLKDLDLDAFAEELDRQGYGKKNTTLYDISLELSNPFKDRFRRHQAELTEVERFEMLTKETPDTLFVGKLVLVTAISYLTRKPGEDEDKVGELERAENGNWKCPFCEDDRFLEIQEVWAHFDSKTCAGKQHGVRVQLENGLQGTIYNTYLSDHPVDKPEQKVQLGQTFYARIRTLDVTKFRVTLTSRTSDLVDQHHEFAPPKDPNYDDATETYDRDYAKAENEKKQKSKQYLKRVIVHPNFANVTYEECIKKLEFQEQGDCLFRPSSKGPGYLTCTWKVEEGIYQHISIEEQKQENSFSLGKLLVINGQEFEDLDEVIATFIKPMTLMVREISQYKYYFKATDDRTVIERDLLQQKMANPSKIPYFLTPCIKRPGYFFIVYLPRQTVIWEYISISQNGFKYRDKVFDSLNKLLGWFKIHFREPRPDRRPPQMSTGANGMHHSSAAAADYGLSLNQPTPSSSRPHADYGRQPTPRVNDPASYHRDYSAQAYQRSSMSPPVKAAVATTPYGSYAQNYPASSQPYGSATPRGHPVAQSAYS